MGRRNADNDGWRRGGGHHPGCPVPFDRCTCEALFAAEPEEEERERDDAYNAFYDPDWGAG
jgi:hypothetical protein